MRSKIGFHVDIRSYPGQLEKLIEAKPTTIKVISSLGFMNDLYQELRGHTVFIMRDWIYDNGVGQDDFLRFKGDMTPEQAAGEWLWRMRSKIEQVPFAYVESFNEMSSFEPDDMAAYGAFEAERQRLMAQEGFRCCVGNFSAGNPPIRDNEEDEGEDAWPYFYEALDACNQYLNVLGLHEYAGLWMSLWYGPNQTFVDQGQVTWLNDLGTYIPFPRHREEGWLFGRYRKVWRRHLEANSLTNVRIVLTEFGLDWVGSVVTQAMAGYSPVGAWTTCGPAWTTLDNRPDTAQYYVDQLIWADKEMQRDPYMIGSNIFTWGTLSDFWRNWDIEGPVADLLIAYIKGE